MEKENYNNIFEWRAARAKYEAELRSGSVFAFDFVEKCGGHTIDAATDEIERVVQFYLKEWEEKNPMPEAPCRQVADN